MDPTTNITFDKAHLKPLETAARIFCQMNGDDPDKPVRVPHPLGLQVPFTEPLWHHAAENLMHLTQMLAALKQAHTLSAQESVKGPH